MANYGKISIIKSYLCNSVSKPHDKRFIETHVLIVNQHFKTQRTISRQGV